ncbi:MAG: peptidoglycan D,D-transpeptidase FtsI [Gammaproteobacteria bacterium]|nr:MAG: peptidoglycan D,D-transpeptidase FtsI [Gammaproteobacteria bacterium]
MTGAQEAGFPGRRRLVKVLLLVITAGLLWRAVDLQHTDKDFLIGQGDARHLRVEAISAHRGKILDRNGEPLAISTPVDSVWANPRELATAPRRWRELGTLLGLDLGQLERTLAQRGEREFVYLKRQVAPELASKVEQAGVPGVYLQREYRRYYPLGEVAAHVVGFTNVDDIGQEGMELAFDERLRGVAGAQRVLRDRLGRIVEEVESIRPPKAGGDLVLSLDRRIQYLAYRALLRAVKRSKARGGSVVVLEARTGEVLAMVNQPAYNPNNSATRVSSRYRNRAVTDVFEPGSTIKPFTIAAALESGRFTAESTVDTSPGSLKIGKYTVRDPRNYGVIDLSTLIQKSSNVGAARVALALEPRELWQALSRVGFGSGTGSGFPGEAQGVLTHYFDWGKIQRASLSFGYGLSVTALQLAQAYAVLANDGRFVRISFERLDQPVEGVPVLGRATAQTLRKMLESVVGPAGTARRARVVGYRVGGKTGTVRKVVTGGYAEDRFRAVFAGMAPITRPRLVVVVVIDEPGGKEYYGGQVAAPVYAEIMTRAMRVLGVPPDDPSVIKRQADFGPEPPRATRWAYAPNADLTSEAGGGVVR